LIEVLENDNPFHNPESPFDVNSDDEVTPLDALLILNALSQNGAAGPISQFPPPGRYWDVNGDGMITPLDALLILNYLNVRNRTAAVSEPEGDSDATGQSGDTNEDLNGIVGPVTSPEPSGRESQDDVSGNTIIGPLQNDLNRSPSGSDSGRLRFAFPDDLSTLIPERFRDFNFRGLITDGKLDLAELRDRLIERLEPSDWDLLQRLESAIRRTPIDRTTVEAIDRALLAINAGWNPDELA